MNARVQRRRNASGASACAVRHGGHRAVAISKSGCWPPDQRLGALTAREMQVLRMLGGWKRKDEIASLLGISLRTVEAHRAHIREKFGFGSSSELLKFAVRWLERQSQANRET